MFWHMNQEEKRKEKKKKIVNIKPTIHFSYTSFIYGGDVKHLPNAAMDTSVWLTSEATCTTQSV